MHTLSKHSTIVTRRYAFTFFSSAVQIGGCCSMPLYRVANECLCVIYSTSGIIAKLTENDKLTCHCYEQILMGEIWGIYHLVAMIIIFIRIDLHLLSGSHPVKCLFRQCGKYNNCTQSLLHSIPNASGQCLCNTIYKQNITEVQ